jgi:SRSO17 transposase
MNQAQVSSCDFPLSARLYLPEIWAEDRERRQSVHVPETLTLASKPELARPLLDRAQAWGMPFATVVTDAGYGIPSFLRALDERHLPYVCAVASELASACSAKWRENSRGTLRKQFVALRVHAGTGCARHTESHGRRWTGPEGLLLGERPLPGEEGEPKWFFSCLPAETPLPRLVELAHLRWPVEQFYEDGEGEGGLDHFQGRSWEGLHRHLALVMLIFTFLMLHSLGQQGQTDPTPGAAFPPCAAIEPSGLPSIDARSALPGCGLMAH